MKPSAHQFATLAAGDFVVAPWAGSCGTCPPCRNGVQVAREHTAAWGESDENGLPLDGREGEVVPVPSTDGTLVEVLGVTEPDEGLSKSLLAICDALGT